MAMNTPVPPDTAAIVKYVGIAVAALIVLYLLWPFYSVPTGIWDGKLPENVYGSAPIPFLNVNRASAN